MEELSSFIRYYFLIQFLALLFWPWWRKVFFRWPDQGWALSKIGGILIAVSVSWWLGSLRLVPFNNFVLLGIIIFSLGLVVWLYSGVGEGWLNLFKLPFLLVLSQELLFLLAAVLWAYLRAREPQIRGLEKFMDYGFVVSILRGAYFPPLDHFFAGGTINYYYFGHLIAAFLIRGSGVKPAVGFNLQISFLFALTVLQSFNLAFSWARKILQPAGRLGAVLAGILGFFFVCLAGNLHFIHEVLAGRAAKYWYPTASRLVPYTINEFPVYSFIVADLHAHVSAMPLVLLMLGLLSELWYQLAQRGKIEIATLLAWVRDKKEFFFSLAGVWGALYVTNSWDFAIYGALLGLIFFLSFWRQDFWELAFLKAWLIFLPLLVGAVLFFLPFWLTVHPFSQGVGLVHNRSPLNLLFLLWGGYGLLVILYLLVNYLPRFWAWKNKIFDLREQIKEKVKSFFYPLKKRSPATAKGGNSQQLMEQWLLLLFSLAALLIILPEIIYVKDIYQPDYYRANTMFKFGFQAWIMLALGSSIAVMRVLEKVWSWRGFFRFLVYLFYFSLLGSMALYTYIAIKTAYFGGPRRLTLDGSVFLEKFFPADAAAIKWLNQNVKGQPVIVEAVGESYTDYARISSFTGLPAVLGWPVHEWLWRGSWDVPAPRVKDVQEIYESADLNLTRELLRKYQVRYIYLGKMEREKYPQLKEEKFFALGELVYQNQGAKIFRFPQ